MSEAIQVHQPCPACGSSDALAVYPDHTYCFSCQARRDVLPGHFVSVRDLPSSPGMSNRGTPLPLLEDLRFGPLSDRGITAETCRKWGYGLVRLGDQTVQVAPYHDAAGRVVAQKVRRPGKQFEVRGDLSKARLFGAQLWGSGGKMVVVTEGEVDALAVSQVQDNRWPVVSVPSGAGSAAGALRRELEWLTSFERVVLCFDMDEPGREAARECAELLPPGKAFVAALPTKDAADCLARGQARALRDALWQAAPWRPDGVLGGLEALERARSQDDVASVPWGLPGLDARTEGLRQGEVTVLTGGTGSGKTTLAQQLVADSLDAGLRVGIVSLESPLRRVVLDLCAILRGVGRQEDFDDANVAAWSAVADRVSVYQHYGSTGADNVLSRMRFMARSLEADLLVLDHLSIVVSGADADADERRTIDRIMTRLATLAQEVEVPIVVVSHLRRPSEGAHEEGARVTLADLRGSGAIAQLARCVIAVERDQQKDGGAAQLRVLKCTYTGRLGPADSVRYDPERSRLVPETAAGYGMA